MPEGFGVKHEMAAIKDVGVRQNSSFGRGVPPGRPDASARRPYHVYEEFCLTPQGRPGALNGRLSAVARMTSDIVAGLCLIAHGQRMA